MRTLMTMACLLGTTALAHAAPLMVPITACGDVVPRHAIGYLTGDLDCTGVSAAVPAAVLLNKQATLELRGFTLTGGLMGIQCGEMRPRRDLPPALYSSGKCAVVGGGGRVTGAQAHGVTGDKPTVTDLTVDGCGQEGIYARLEGHIQGVTVSGNAGRGILIYGKADVDASTIVDNGEDGIEATRIRLSNSTVTGNASGPECGPYPLRRCGDLATSRSPRVTNSTCGTSLVVGHGVPQSWNVCTLD